MNAILRAVAVLAAVAVLPVTSGAESLDGAVFRVTLETGGLGPVETHLAFEERDGTVRARSLSRAVETIRQLPGARGEGVDVSRDLLAWTASAEGEGYAGALSAPWAEGEVEFSVAGDTLEGSIQGGLFGGSFRGVRVAEAAPVRDYAGILAAFDVVVDGVGFAKTRETASRAVRPGGVIMHIGLGAAEGGLDIRRITLQEITFVGPYTYTAEDFRATAAAMFAGKLGPLDWYETRPLADGNAAFADIRKGSAEAPKTILKP